MPHPRLFCRHHPTRSNGHVRAYLPSLMNHWNDPRKRHRRRIWQCPSGFLPCLAHDGHRSWSQSAEASQVSWAHRSRHLNECKHSAVAGANGQRGRQLEPLQNRRTQAGGRAAENRSARGSEGMAKLVLGGTEAQVIAQSVVWAVRQQQVRGRQERPASANERPQPLQWLPQGPPGPTAARRWGLRPPATHPGPLHWRLQASGARRLPLLLGGCPRYRCCWVEERKNMTCRGGSGSGSAVGTGLQGIERRPSPPGNNPWHIPPPRTPAAAPQL